MTAYRTLWRLTFAITTIAALLAAGTSIGWPSVLVAVGSVAVGGAVAGYAWIEDPQRRRRSMVELALWFGAGAALIVGLPELLGPWSILAPALFVASAPRVISWVRDNSRRSRPVDDPDQAQRVAARDLDARWLQTSRQLRERRGDPAAVLALVQERAILLDEIERRDPVGFEALLVRAGWRERQGQ